MSEPECEPERWIRTVTGGAVRRSAVRVFDVGTDVKLDGTLNAPEILDQFAVIAIVPLSDGLVAFRVVEVYGTREAAQLAVGALVAE